MKRFSAKLGLRNGNLTAEQQLNSYAAPPPPPPAATIERRTPSKSKEEIEIDQEKELRNLNASPDYVRRVRELIREKYRLDVKIWSKRYTHKVNRPYVLKDCKRSDDTLAEICGIVSKWERDLFEEEEEWAIVSQIRAGVSKCQQEEVPWLVVPPWERTTPGRAGVGRAAY